MVMFIFTKNILGDWAQSPSPYNKFIYKFNIFI